MPAFKYKAATRDGKTRKGIIDAVSRSQAVQLLREDGLYPLDLKKAAARSDNTSRADWRKAFQLRSRVPKDKVAATVRQLATLLQADLTMDKTLQATIRGAEQHTMGRILTQIREAILEGSDVAGAFASHPRVFDETFVTMVRAGEASGKLSIVMERLADHMERQLALKRTVQASLAYPVFTLLVGVGVVIFLLAFVVPKVTEIFIGMDRALPLPTQILISVSDAFREGWPVALLILTLLGFGLHRFLKTNRGKQLFDGFILKVPVLSEVVRLVAVGRFTETLGMLLKNDTTLLSSLTIAQNVVSNTHMKKVIKQVAHDVQEGKPLTGPLEESDIFDHATVQMIAAGDQSNRLGDMLLTVAKGCENKLNTRLQVLTSLLEPLMILLLGSMVGFVVMAVLLPIFEMSNLIGG